MTVLYYLISYLVGSIPFSYITAKYLGKVDIRKYGSGNSGATNVFRVLGKKAGLLAFIGDFVKGFVVSIIAKKYLDLNTALICSYLAVIGHCYPITLKFKGGKGVATSGGTLFGLYPSVGFILLITQIVMLKASKMMSLASITVAAFLPILAFILNKPKSFIIYGFFLGIFVIYRHKSNIKRIIEGKESKISFKK